MRDERKGSVGRGSPDIEGGLGRLAAAPVPPGLRRRVMDRALEARRNVALTPRLRTLAFVCATVILTVLTIDPLVGRHDAARWAALLDGPSSARPAVDGIPELVELLGGRGSDAGWISRLQALAASAAQNERKMDLIEARKRLKGWIENETSENLD